MTSLTTSIPVAVVMPMPFHSCSTPGIGVRAMRYTFAEGWLREGRSMGALSRILGGYL